MTNNFGIELLKIFGIDAKNVIWANIIINDNGIIINVEIEAIPRNIEGTDRFIKRYELMERK